MNAQSPTHVLRGAMAQPDRRIVKIDRRIEGTAVARKRSDEKPAGLHTSGFGQFAIPEQPLLSAIKRVRSREVPAYRIPFNNDSTSCELSVKCHHHEQLKRYAWATGSRYAYAFKGMRNEPFSQRLPPPTP